MVAFISIIYILILSYALADVDLNNNITISTSNPVLEALLELTTEVKYLRKTLNSLKKCIGEDSRFWS